MKNIDSILLVVVALCIGVFVIIYLPWIFIRSKAAKYDPHDKRPEEGVEGWLLLMLVQVFSLAPTFSSIQLLALMKTVQELESQAFTNFTYALIGLTLTILLVTFRYHLPLITTRAAKAVLEVKRVYLLLPFAATVGFYLCSKFFLESTMTSVHRALVSELPGIFFSSGFGSAIWFWYLSKSKRVAATYRKNATETKKIFPAFHTAKPSRLHLNEAEPTLGESVRQRDTVELKSQKETLTLFFEDFQKVKIKRSELEALEVPYDHDVWRVCLSKAKGDEVSALAFYLLMQRPQSNHN